MGSTLNFVFVVSFVHASICEGSDRFLLSNFYRSIYTDDVQSLTGVRVDVDIGKRLGGIKKFPVRDSTPTLESLAHKASVLEAIIDLVEFFALRKLQHNSTNHSLCTQCPHHLECLDCDKCVEESVRLTDVYGREGSGVIAVNDWHSHNASDLIDFVPAFPPVQETASTIPRVVSNNNVQSPYRYPLNLADETESDSQEEPIEVIPGDHSEKGTVDKVVINDVDCARDSIPYSEIKARGSGAYQNREDATALTQRTDPLADILKCFAADHPPGWKPPISRAFISSPHRVPTGRNMIYRDSGRGATGRPNLNDTAMTSICPPVPPTLKNTHFTFTLSNQLPFPRVMVELTKCLTEFKHFVFRQQEFGWRGIVTMESASCDVEIKIYLLNPTIPQYAVQCERMNGDIHPFYTFFREFHSLLNNVVSNDLCKEEELADLSDELIKACANNKKSLAEMYLGNKLIDINRMNKDGKAAIHVACEGGHRDIIALLVEHKANVMLRDRSGHSPIDCAILSKHFEVVELLHERYNITMRVGRATNEIREDFLNRSPTLGSSSKLSTDGMISSHSHSSSVSTYTTKPVNFDTSSKNTAHNFLNTASKPVDFNKLSTSNYSKLATGSSDKRYQTDGTGSIFTSALVTNRAGFGLKDNIHMAQTQQHAAFQKVDDFRYVDNSVQQPLGKDFSITPYASLNVKGSEFTHKESVMIHKASVHSGFGKDSIQSQFHAQKSVESPVPKFVGKGLEPSLSSPLMSVEVTKSEQNKAIQQNVEEAEDSMELDAAFESSSSSDMQDDNSSAFSNNLQEYEDDDHIPIDELNDLHDNKRKRLGPEYAGYLDSLIKPDYSIPEVELSTFDSKFKDSIVLIPVANTVSFYTLLKTYLNVMNFNILTVSLSQQFTDMLTEVINKGENVNAKDHQMNTLLHYATRFNHIDAMSVVIAAGADVNMRNGNLSMPLHIATEFGHHSAVQVLLKTGEVLVDSRDCNLRTALSKACQTGQYDVCLELLTAGANANLFDEYLKTPLHYASEFGHTAVVELLTDRFGASHRNVVKIRTPLHWAALSGHLETCRMLLTQGDDVDVTDANDDTPLILACIASHFKVVQLLAQYNAKVDVLNMNCKTALHYCQDRDVRKMLSHGLVLRMFQGVSDGNLSEITLLLNLGVRVDCKDQNHNTPLFMACKFSAEKVIELLMLSGANPSSQNKQGMTPIMEASRIGNVSIMRLLLLSDIDKPPDLSLKDRFGRTAVHIASANGHLEILKLFLLPVPVPPPADMIITDTPVNTVVNFAINVDTTNILGNTSLSTAVAGGRKEVVDFLVAYGGTVQMEDNLGRSVHTFIPPPDAVPLYIDSQAQPQSATAPANNATVSVEPVTNLPTTLAAVSAVFQSGVQPTVVHPMGSLSVSINAQPATTTLVALVAGVQSVVQPAVQPTGGPSSTIIAQPVTSEAKDSPMDIEIAPAVVPPSRPKVLIPDAHWFITKALNRIAIQLLYHAAKFGMFARVKEIIIKNGRSFNLNARVEDTVVVYKEGKIFALQTNYETALYAAAFAGHTDVVRLLLQARASGTILARNGWSPIFAACKKSHTEIVKLLIAVNVDVNLRNKNDMTCVNIASYNGDIEIMKALIDAGADINQGDVLGARPLHASVQNKKFDAVQILVDAGADLNLTTTTGITPLYVAAFNGHNIAVEMFIARGALIDKANHDGLTPLLVAAYNGRVDCVKTLIAAGANLEAVEKNKVSALYAACQNNHVEVVDLLIKAGANYNIKIINLNTPVHSACIENRPAILKLLMDAGADLTAQSIDGATPLYMACERGRLEAVNMLVDSGKVDLNMPNKHKVTPINIASQNGFFSIVKKLVDNGADVNIQTELGPTPLFISSQNGFPAITRVLIDAGANLDSATREGESAVFVASYFGHVEVVRMLIESGATVNMQDRDGRTPIWWASKAGRSEIVKMLIDAKADVNVSDRENKTPTQVAMQFNHPDVCELLSEANKPAQLCSICLENPRNMLYLPCKHFSVCFDCDLKMIKRGQPQCVMCREAVVERHRVFGQ